MYIIIYYYSKLNKSHETRVNIILTYKIVAEVAELCFRKIFM